MEGEEVEREGKKSRMMRGNKGREEKEGKKEQRGRERRE